jgi:3-oxoadipate enol-lactonase
MFMLVCVCISPREAMEPRVWDMLVYGRSEKYRFGGRDSRHEFLSRQEFRQQFKNPGFRPPFRGRLLTPTTRANGIDIYYEVHGEGNPLVLISGLGSGMSLFSGLIPSLSKTFKVVAFDNRGVGRTDKPRTPYTVDMMAQDTAELLHSIGIERTFVLGVSMGGRIAMALTLEHSEMVQKLVLVSTAARVTLSSRSSPQFSMVKAFQRIAGSGLFGGYAQPYYAFVRQLEASRSYDCTRRLDRIAVPTLILYGKKDGLAVEGLVDETSRGIAGAETRAFEGGHMFFLLRREEFLESVKGFLNGPETIAGS